MLGLNRKSKENFLEFCTCFNVRDRLNYSLPTPLEVYENFSNFKNEEKPAYEVD